MLAVKKTDSDQFVILKKIKFCVSLANHSFSMTDQFINISQELADLYALINLMYLLEDSNPS